MTLQEQSPIHRISETFQNLSSEMMVVVGRDGKILSLNKSACTILGTSLQESIGKDWFETFVPETSRNSARTVFNIISFGGAAKVAEVVGDIVTTKNEKKVISWHNGAVTTEQGVFIAAVSSGTVITDQPRANG